MKYLSRINYQFIFMIGITVISIIKLDITSAREMYYWLLIHLEYDGKCVDSIKLPLRQRIVNILTFLTGFIFITFVIGILIFIVISLLKVI